MFRTILAGGVAIFVLLAMVVGLMELHAPPPAFACPDPDAPCEGCYTEGGCYFLWHHYNEVTHCCWYRGYGEGCPYWEYDCNPP